MLRPGGRETRSLHVHVYAVGGPAQRDLAERPQVRSGEEALDCALRLIGYVDLALMQPLHQLARRQVHHLHRVGVVEHLIWDGLPDLDAGYPGDDVVQALQVLDVERGVDADARFEQLLDVLPALGVPGARSVGVGQLVHQHQLRVALEGSVEVELAQLHSPVIPPRRREYLQPLHQHFGLHPAVRLHIPYDHFSAGGRQLLCGVQHGIGLAHAGHVTEEDLQAAPPVGRLPGAQLLQQTVGVGATVLLQEITARLGSRERG